ncbi:uncharacterized protein [Solanum tuberosum]|uniref:Uncharacterized protein n=1 Tax=Solanum tuberosum TaxID=4113 RepID=M0ZXR0_SOLTU|nr:PREDICTED: uncharacterized protein LOC102585326 isoform X2 [Solanum tuberosum]
MGIFVISFVILSPFHSTWLLCWHPCLFHRPSSYSLLLHQNKNWAVFFHHKDIAAILSGYGHKFLRVSNNLDLKMGLFICYVREYFIVKQVAGEERLLFWAVCNIQLQVISSVTTLIFFISFAPPPET